MAHLSQNEQRRKKQDEGKNEQRPTTNPSISNHGFTGHRHNNTGANNPGLIYMNARYYLLEIGRFISPDTIVPDPANPQSYNRYSYVRNSPMNFTDPTGHMECQIFCEGDIISEQEIKFGSAYGGEWDPEKQAANRAKAEAITTAMMELAAAAWEPTDWTVALSDGFQWYDTIGMVPLIPSTVGRHVDKVTGAAARRVAEEAGTTAHTVYQFVENGIVKYIGITNDFSRRASEHLSSRKWAIQAIRGLGELTRAEARAVEQVLIERYKLENLYNQINSISSRNPIYNEAVERGKELLKAIEELKIP